MEATWGNAVASHKASYQWNPSRSLSINLTSTCNAHLKLYYNTSIYILSSETNLTSHNVKSFVAQFVTKKILSRCQWENIDTVNMELAILLQSLGPSPGWSVKRTSSVGSQKYIIEAVE